MKEKGFSLIELLVGIAIIITATTVVLSIIVSSFRISGKSTSNSVVRQNGNYAMAQMSRIIQFADSFDGAYDASGSFYPTCDDDVTKSYSTINVHYGGNPKSLVCRQGASGGIEIGDGVNPPQEIIDTKMSVTSCHFTCTQDNGAVAPVIGINFGLNLGDSNTVVEKTSHVDFSTSVKMRNP